MSSRTKDVAKKPVKSSKAPERERKTHKEKTRAEELTNETKPAGSSRTQRSAISETNPKVRKSLTATGRTVKRDSSVSKEIKSANPAAKLAKPASVDRPSSRVVRTQYFPSKQMMSNVVRAEKLKQQNAGETPTRETLKETPKQETLKQENTKQEREKQERQKQEKPKQEKQKQEMHKQERQKLERPNQTKPNHEKPKQEKQKPERQRQDDRKTLTKRTREYEYSSSENSVSVERPRTATLRKGSIVNMNIAGPGVPKRQSKTSDYRTESESDDYEDDFESYESDFEEYSPSSNSSISEELTENETNAKISKTLSNELEEDRKLDSGNFELPEYKHKHMLDNIRESIEQENNTLSSESRSSNMASLSDEGFEDGKSAQGIPFFNFLDAQKKFRLRKSAEKKRRRGQELLSLIKLDTQSFTLFEFEPIAYNTFIKMYGSHNAVQTSTQTGDDNISEETQTDAVETSSKWTQFPITFSKIDVQTEGYMEIYKKEYSGVGGDQITTKTNLSHQANHSEERLFKFFNSASKVILTIFEERNQYSLGNINGLNNVPFSNGYVSFNTSKSLLKNRPVTNVTFSLRNDTFLTIHANQTEDFVDKSGVLLRSVICLWNIYHPDEPQKIITAYGDIKCCCFGLNEEFVYGGLEDGTIVVWNTESPTSLKEISLQEEQYNLPLPTFITDINNGHMCTVVAIKSITDTPEHLFQSNSMLKSSSEQICTLDEDGTLIFWAILLKTSKSNQNNVTLVQNSIVSLKAVHPELSALCCTDMIINIKNSNHLFISTNYGYIIHCLTSNSKPIPTKYIPEVNSVASCLSCCPFSPNYFMAGHEDGNVYLYSISIEKCLKTMNNKADDSEQCRIEMVEWSYSKPFIFYSKDNNNTIHIWDLESSDIFPTYSIPFKDKISFMKLAPTIPIKDKIVKRSYMVIVTENGSIHLHLLNSEHGPQAPEKYQDDVRMFYKYVNRL